MANIKKHKTKLIAVVIIAVALVIAWTYGDTPITGGEQTPPVLALLYAEEYENGQGASEANGQEDASENEKDELAENGEYENGNIENDGNGELENAYGEINGNESNAANQDATGDNAEQDSETAANENNLASQNENTENSLTQTDGQSSGQTDVQSQDNQINEDGSFTVTLSVRVDTILPNMHILNSEKHELIPSDGVIFATRQVTAYEGESVFNVLQREMRRHGIHMASRFMPVFNSAYVEAINNIYEFDVGPLSGWMYRVNGDFPNFGSSRYILRPGDVIEWLYTVDLGRDIGGHAASAGQRGE